MKLFTFFKDGRQLLGVKKEETLIDVSAALSENPNESVPRTVMEILRGGKEAFNCLENFINGIDLTYSKITLQEEAIQWGPCVTEPNKIICVGLNYRKHADETHSPHPEVPILFNKFNNTLTGHKCEIEVPKVTDQLDYEVELGIVIGKEAKNVSKERALDYVFGYCTANDLSARDLQMTTSQWLLGKSCDHFSPIGPYLVSSDEVGNPNNLKLKTLVNGEVRQDSTTSDMIFYCDEIVSYISKHMTLTPGDLILTGTPEGVIMGYPKDQQVYLKPGDEVTVSIEKLGVLTNKFIEEK